MKKFIAFTLCLLICLSSTVFTSCGSSDGKITVSDRTSVAIISNSLQVSEADRYTLTCGDKQVNAANNAYNIIGYEGGLISIKINSHNVSDAYKDYFDNDETFSFTFGVPTPAKDTVILIFAELTTESGSLMLTLTQRAILTDENGNVTVNQTAGIFNITSDRGTVYDIYES